MRRFVLTLLLGLLAALCAAAPAFAKLDEKEWKKAQAEFQAAFDSGDVDGMVSAIKTLAQDQSKRAIDLLVGLGASDKLDNIQVYDAVREALAGMGGEADTLKYMMDQLAHKSDPKFWTLRCVLVDGLSGVQGAEVTRAIAARLDDKVPYVVSAAAKALGKRRDKEGVDPLIKKLAELEKNKDVTWIDVRQALTAITGFDFQSAKEWDGYWIGKKDTFDPEKDRGDKQDVTTDVRDEPKFFNEPIISKRIMFVIDVSGSMMEKDIPREGKGTMTRIEVVKNELAATVKQLKPDAKFNIISFSHVIKAWRPSKQGLQPATPDNKADALKWISALKADGATHTDDALKEAFANIDVNTIVLLSDGAPARANMKAGTTEPIDPKKVLELAAGLNRLRNVKIHTFCFKVFENMPGMAECLQFMEDLAKQNGGKLNKV
jgi:Mg-chelatase subunit ChlD